MKQVAQLSSTQHSFFSQLNQYFDLRQAIICEIIF